MVEKKRKEKTNAKGSRAKYQNIPELDELIRQYNLIPQDFSMQNLKVVLESQRLKLIKQTGDEDALPSIEEAVEICLDKTPVEFQDYVRREAHIRYDSIYSIPVFGFSQPHYICTLAVVYSEYFEMRMSFWALLKQLELERQEIRQEEIKRGLRKGTGTFEHFTLSFWEYDPLIITTVVGRSQGNLQITGLAALIGNFDDSRLRRCEICSRAFWASRDDAETCSKPCANVRRVRRTRSLTDEQKAEIKAQRAANRNHNKKLKEMRKNKNGAL